MTDLGSWMNKILTDRGMDPEIANTFDKTIIAILMIFIAVGLDYLCRAIFVGGIRRLARRTPYKWDTLMVRYKVIHHLIHTLPDILMYMLLPMAFVHGKTLLLVSQKICVIYMIFALPLALSSSLLMLLDILSGKKKLRNRPMKGFIQVLQVFVFSIDGIVIVFIIVDKSPTTLFAGLGASTAILMLVFKDSILGFMTDTQLSANDVIRPGDWVTIPSTNANGIMEGITLSTVKIQNLDNTISTIPPYPLANGSFQNWRGMTESGRRRVMKSIFLDLTTLKFCTPETLDTFREEIPLLADYQPEEEVVPANSQVFRVYVEHYLCSLPVVNQDLNLIISQKETIEYGVPIQIYFSSRNKVWKEYKRIQSDILDHFFAMVPKFEPKIYQYSG